MIGAFDILLGLEKWMKITHARDKNLLQKCLSIDCGLNFGDYFKIVLQ